jgi:hypothetical protein
MSTSDPHSSPGAQPTEEELRAAYEEEIKKVRVEQVLLEHVVTLVNLGMRRTGLAPGTESERDAGQVQLAIESVRVLLPVIETVAPAHVKPIRDALSQLQLAYVQIGGQAKAGVAEAGSAGAPGAAAGSPGAAAGSPGAAAGSPASPSPQPADTAEPPPERPATGGPPEPESPPGSEGPGPAQRSGRLWIPGQ